MRLLHGIGIAVLAASLACTGETPLATVEPPPDAGCVQDTSARTYAVYFVLDVSGSMEFFLKRLATQLQSFAESFPKEDNQDNPVFVDYYVVAFVNDVRWFPDGASRRMTSPIAVQAAIEQARLRGATNLNLTRDAFNAEEDENLLDALNEVVASAPSADKTMVIVATDAGFAEAPTVLSTDLPVHSTFEEVRAGLQRINAEVHAFTPDQLDGITRNYRGMPALTTLDGSSQNRLESEAGSAELIASALTNIADRNSCN